MKPFEVQNAPATTIGQLATAIPAEEVQSWPEHSRNAVLATIAKFGLPDIMNAEILIWRNGSDPVVVEKHNGFIGQDGIRD